MLYCCRPIWQVCILHVSIIRVKAVEWPKNFINFFQQEAIFTDVFFTLTPTALGCRHQMLPPCPWNRCWQCIAEQGRRELGSWGLQKMFREHGIDFISGITCWPGHSWWTEQWAGWARSCQRSGQRWRGNPAKCVIPSILTFVPSFVHLRSASQCTCWRRAGWRPPSGRSRCRGRGGRWRAACTHTSSSGTRPTSCPPEQGDLSMIILTIQHECVKGRPYIT